LALNGAFSCVAFLLAVAYVAGLFSSAEGPVQSAMAECRARGWHDGEIGLSGSEVNNYGLLSTATVTWLSKDKDRPRVIRAELRNWLNVAGWQVVEIKEE